MPRAFQKYCIYDANGQNITQQAILHNTTTCLVYHSEYIIQRLNDD